MEGGVRAKSTAESIKRRKKKKKDRPGWWWCFFSFSRSEYLVFSSLFIRRIIFVPRQLYSHARSLLNGSAIVSDFETPSAFFCSSYLLLLLHLHVHVFSFLFFFISLFCSKSLSRKDPSFAFTNFYGCCNRVSVTLAKHWFYDSFYVPIDSCFFLSLHW